MKSWDWSLQIKSDLSLSLSMSNCRSAQLNKSTFILFVIACRSLVCTTQQTYHVEVMCLYFVILRPSNYPVFLLLVLSLSGATLCCAGEIHICQSHEGRCQGQPGPAYPNSKLTISILTVIRRTPNSRDKKEGSGQLSGGRSKSYS